MRLLRKDAFVPDCIRVRIGNLEFRCCIDSEGIEANISRSRSKVTFACGRVKEFIFILGEGLIGSV